MPNAVLDTQPALRRLKEGLVDAQLRAANLTGSLSAEHPQALAATTAVQKIKNQLLTELRVAIRTLDGDLRNYVAFNDTPSLRAAISTPQGLKVLS